MAAIDWNKVREVAKALAALNADEMEALYTTTAIANEARKGPPAAVQTKAKPGPKPDTRLVRCPFCADVNEFSPHGLKIHVGRRHKTGDLFPKETKGE